MPSLKALSMAYWGWKLTPEIPENTKCITVRILPDFGIHKEARNKKKILT